MLLVYFLGFFLGGGVSLALFLFSVCLFFGGRGGEVEGAERGVCFVVVIVFFYCEVTSQA